MVDIRIKHCRLSLRRRSGWSWGANPRALAENASRLLPELIAKQLSHLLGASARHQTLKSLSIRVPITVDEIVCLSSPTLFTGNRASQPRTLPDRVHAVLSDQLAAEIVKFSAVEEQKHVSDIPLKRLNGSQASIIHSLRSWYSQGVLFKVLRACDKASLQLLEKQMRKELSVANGPGYEIEQSSIPMLIHALEHEFRVSLPLPNIPMLRLAVSACWLAQAKFTPSIVSLDKFLSKRIICSLAVGEEELGMSNQATSKTAVEKVNSAVIQPPQRILRAKTQVDVPSILPFVITGVLARSAYLGLFDSLAEASDLSDQADCFGAALAYKVSAPPNQGWQRKPASQKLAAAMVGASDPPDNVRIRNFLNLFEGATQVLKSHRLILQLEAASSTLLTQIRVNKTNFWALIDIDTAAPVCLAETHSEIQGALAECSEKNILLDANVVSENLHRRLSRLGHKVVSKSSSDDGLMLEDFETLSASVTALMTRLMIEGASVLPIEESTFSATEIELAVATAGALGVIANGLSSDDNRLSPMDIITMFSDHEALVIFEDNRIVVRPALGQRYLDLYRNNFLLDIRRVSWLHGRTIEFAGL